mmetsp:Transcript_15511/g.52325  ORF Transcript_15511/g.52325 Transcript_15511/m.52325 type:complete len:267 (+) Transcript_15511:254-1054(+)
MRREPHALHGPRRAPRAFPKRPLLEGPPPGPGGLAPAASLARAHSSSFVAPIFSSWWHTPQACGQVFDMKALELSLSHSPALAQPLHESSLSMHTLVHTPHASGQIGITVSGFLWHSAALAQMSHWVVLKSWHSRRVEDLHTLHECGHFMYMCVGLELHSPLAVHPGQSECRSLHVDVHVPHVAAQLRSMNSGLVTHWSYRGSGECHAAQSGLTSLQTGAQMPQLVGQMVSMDCMFFSHSPALAQLGQLSSLSEHSNLQIPHEMGQ